MTDQNALIQPYVTHTATAIIRQNSNTAWTSAVEKFTAPEPSPTYVDLSPPCELQNVL